MTAISLAATGMSWSDAASKVNMTSEALRKWRKHPDTQPFLERVVTENLLCAKHTAISHSKRAVEVLVEIMEDKTARPTICSIKFCMCVIG
ncbi:helix-turn-helix domain-containing protein [Prochlorococcus marinus]|uniref:helix-turn-helix domain-containing protein n=1 Tax=Prochlorococcus marinus TaxID=1219 RepID=UPI0022B474F3|nr:helix-turn-helix domain-containing protein [Prochlorococcus marinus]